MKTLKYIFSLVIILSLMLVVGCTEAKEGADAIADEVTGKNKIEKKIEVEDKLKKLQEEQNKKQQEALEQIK